MRIRGFTLLELLLALALVSMVAGTLYGTLYIAKKAHDSATQAVEAPRTAGLCMELIAQDLNTAMPPTGLLTGVFVGTYGGGAATPDSLQFVSCGHDPQEGETASDMRQVQFLVETLPGESQPVLSRQVTTNLLATQSPLVREQVLCRHVKQFRLRYFDGSLWQDSWDSSATNNILPLAVEVTLEFGVETPQGLPERTYQVIRVFRLECGLNSQTTSD